MLTNHFNKLTEDQAERLAILAEECAEVIQAVGKVLRHGYDSVNPLIQPHGDDVPVTNQMLLEKELGHVLTAQRLLWQSNDIRKFMTESYADEKDEKIQRWLHHHGTTRKP